MLCLQFRVYIYIYIYIYIVNTKKLETALRTNGAGIPYTFLLRIEAFGFPTFGLLLCVYIYIGLRVTIQSSDITLIIITTPWIPDHLIIVLAKTLLYV